MILGAPANLYKWPSQYRGSRFRIEEALNLWETDVSLSSSREMFCRTGGHKRGTSVISNSIPERVSGIACLGLLLVCLAGCGGSSQAVTVTGKVVYKGTGEPASLLAGGSVGLQSVTDPENKPVGKIDDDGTFFLGTTIGEKNLGGVLPGEYRGRVIPPQNEAGRTDRRLIDPRYMSFDKSEIRVTIKPGKNELTIEVEKAKR